MNFNSASFPHPILGVDNSIDSYIRQFKNGMYFPLITITPEEYTITLQLEHDNADLHNLIQNNQAEYLFEVTCSSTLYRQSVKSSNNEFKFSINRKQVKGKVEFSCVMVAKLPIPDYKNVKSHHDYDGFNFEIEPGDILAYFGEGSFDVNINYEKLKAVSSFMEVVKNEDLKFTNVDLNKPKIQVQLPKEDYELYSNDSISKEQKFAPIFHSSIVLNALLIALYNFETHKGKTTWANAIEYRLNEKEFETISIKDKENIPEIAQQLLGNPFHRLISELQVIIETPNQNEED